MKRVAASALLAIFLGGYAADAQSRATDPNAVRSPTVQGAAREKPRGVSAATNTLSCKGKDGKTTNYEVSAKGKGSACVKLGQTLTCEDSDGGFAEASCEAGCGPASRGDAGCTVKTAR